MQKPHSGHMQTIFMHSVKSQLADHCYHFLLVIYHMSSIVSAYPVQGSRSMWCPPVSPASTRWCVCWSPARQVLERSPHMMFNAPGVNFALVNPVMYGDLSAYCVSVRVLSGSLHQLVALAGDLITRCSVSVWPSRSHSARWDFPLVQRSNHHH